MRRTGKGVGMTADTEPRRLVRSRATLNSFTPDVIAERFRRNVRTEILRLLNHEHLAEISREEVERVGKDSGLPSSEATHEFLGLKGVVWEGTISRASDSEHLWDMVYFDISWFQRRGETPTS
jgi:hypothetical protein